MRCTGRTCSAPGPVHCRACCQSFGGNRAANRHRVGKHGERSGPDRRRCLSTAELRDKGLTLNAAGIWVTQAPGLALAAAGVELGGPEKV